MAELIPNAYRLRVAHKQRVAQWLALDRQPGNDDVRAQILGVRKQFALPGAAQIREQ